MKKINDSFLKCSVKYIAFIVMTVFIASSVLIACSGNKNDENQTEGLQDIPLEETTLSEGEWEEFIEKEINTEPEDPLSLPQRVLTNECTPYDGIEREIVCWGDSMTQGLGGGDAVITIDGEKKDISGYDYPITLESKTGIRCYNLGASGEYSDQIAARQGGIPLYSDRDIYVNEGEMEEIGVTYENGEHVFYSDFSGYNNTEDKYWGMVYVDGVLCKITSESKYSDGMNSEDNMDESYDYNDPENNILYISTVSGKSIMIHEGDLIIPKASYDMRNNIMILEIGSNGGWGSDYQELIKQYDAMIERYNCKYYIIIGDTDDPGTSIGDLNQQKRNEDGSKIGVGDTAWEAALREAYGDHFINMRAYLIQNGLSDVGMLPGKNDKKNAERGIIPKRLRFDWTHFNSYGYYSKGLAVYQKGVELGYWN